MPGSDPVEPTTAAAEDPASADPVAPDPLAPGPAAPDASAPDASATWRRVHPVTALLRSWQVVAVVAAGAAHSLVQEGPGLLRALRRADSPLDRPLVLLAGLGVLVLIVGALGVSWWFTRYRVTEGALEHVQGVLNRRHRSARLDRIQAVDVVQPVLARIVGLAELRVEVAGGSGSAVKIAYLTDSQASALRNLLLARAAGVRHEGGEAPAAPVVAGLQVPMGRLLSSVLVAPETVMGVLFGIGGVVLGVAVGGLPVEAVVSFLPIALGVGTAVWRRVERGFGFELGAAADGLHLSHGLLQHTRQTLPPGRVQAVRVVQPLTWRPWGLWSIDLTVAGYAGREHGEHQAETSVLLPVGGRDDVLTALHLLWPRAVNEPGAVEAIELALTGAGPDPRLDAASPRRARRLDPFGAPRQALLITDELAIVRRGRFARQVDLMPHERVQSIGVAQGPLQRLVDVVTLTLHTTPGRIAPAARHLAPADAARVVLAEADRARRARSAAGPEHWIGGDALDEPAEAPQAPGIEHLGGA